MRVINTAAYPRVMGYANGRSVPAGGSTPDLKFETIHNPALWKDIGNGQAVIRLSEADKTFMERIRATDAKEVVVQQLASRHKTVERTPVPAARSISASPVPVLHDTVPVPETPATPATPSAVTLAQNARPSLADLKRMNALPADKLADIRQFMGGRV